MEAFKDRASFFELLVSELEETIAIEESMKNGQTMDSPEFLFEQTSEKVTDENKLTEETETFDISNFIEDTCSLIQDMSMLDKSKYMKIQENQSNKSKYIKKSGKSV